MYDYTKIDKKVDNIIEKVSLYMNNLNKDYIKNEIYKAYLYAREAHEWQIRHSWEYYINHPVESTNILVSLHPDLETIQACLLHDVIEDTPKTSEDILKDFWKEVTFLCEWMEKLSKVKYRWEERSIWSLRKMFVAMAEDLRVIFIKLSDRLHNMRTLHFHPNPIKRKRIALETINIYSPIADRLWLYHIKNSLDEEYLKIIQPEDYNRIIKELEQQEKNSIDFLKNVKNEIIEVLNNRIFNYEIDYRVKSIFSIYKKLEKKWLKHVSELYDLYWIRIIVENVSDCYKTLWIIHSIWTPLPQRFKDYIALPKPNWYKSLHTTVMWLLKGSRKQPTEIQIKTYEMKRYSDLWVAAHFEYKEKWSVVAKDVDWVKELKELTQSVWDNDFVWSLKIDVFKDRIFVFTPKWDFINLPAWSTPIDFAYYLHTDLWNHITLAKVNSKVHPLDKELHNWDVVEVIIDKNKTPNPFWVSFVKTVKAKNNIKSFLKKEDKEMYRERWRDIMNKYLEKADIGVFDKDYNLLKVIDWRENNMEERLQLLEQVWNFSISPNNLLKKIVKEQKLEAKIEEKKSKTKKRKIIVTPKNKTDIIIWWQNDLKYVLWACCKRKIPEDIVAHINNKWVITIHNRKCKTLKWVNKDRLLPAYIKWTEDDNLIVTLLLSFQEKIWVFKKLSEILYSMNLDILSINSERVNKNTHNITLKLIILDYEYLIIDRLIDRLKIWFWDVLLNYKIEKMQKE